MPYHFVAACNQFIWDATDMRGWSTFLLIEAGTLDRADIREEEAAGRRARANIDIALIEFDGVLTVHHLLRTGNEGIDGVFKRVEPFAVIDKPGPVRVKLALQLDFLFCQAELLQVAVQFQQNGGSRSLVDLTGFHAHDAIFKDVDFADTVGP